MKNVLLTCVGRRNYLANYFREALAGRALVIGTDMSDTAPGLIDCDQQHLVPGVYTQGYVDQILKLCVENNVGLLVSLNDLELPLLAAAKARFAEIGVSVAISDIDVIDICFDKLATHNWLLENGFGSPSTYADLNEAMHAIEAGSLSFPCVVKPRWGSGSIGVFMAHDLDELRAAHALVQLQVMRSILSTASQADPERCVLVQSTCPGEEYGCDILNDFNGSTKAVVTKQKLAMRGGETDKSVVRNNPTLARLCQSLGDKLGHVGNLDCDIFVNGDELNVLEMNPRFGGGYPFSHVAGARFPQALLAWSNEQSFKPDSSLITFDLPYSKFDTLGRVGDFSLAPPVHRVSNG